MDSELAFSVDMGGDLGLGDGLGSSAWQNEMLSLTRDMRDALVSLSRDSAREGLFGGGGGLAGAVALILGGAAALTAAVTAIVLVGAKAYQNLQSQIDKMTLKGQTSDIPGVTNTPEQTNILQNQSGPVGGMINFPSAANNGLEATPERVWDNEQMTWRSKNADDNKAGILSQYAQDFPFLNKSPLGGGDFLIDSQSITNGVKDTEEELQKIREDGVVTQEEQNRLTELYTETLNVGVELDRQKMEYKKKGVEQTKAEKDAYDAVMTALKDVNLLQQGVIDKQRVSIDNIREETAALESQLAVKKRLSSQSKSSGSSDSFTFVQDGNTYTGRVENLSGVDKVVGVRTVRDAAGNAV